MKKEIIICILFLILGIFLVCYDLKADEIFQKGDLVKHKQTYQFFFFYSYPTNKKSIVWVRDDLGRKFLMSVFNLEKVILKDEEI